MVWLSRNQYFCLPLKFSTFIWKHRTIILTEVSTNIDDYLSCSLFECKALLLVSKLRLVKKYKSTIFSPVCRIQRHWRVMYRKRSFLAIPTIWKQAEKPTFTCYGFKNRCKRSIEMFRIKKFTTQPVLIVMNITSEWLINF